MERKLLSELMKNSRRSDRQLAKAIGASQPTTTRLRSRLEKEGYIKEYTIIPRFSKLGYHILALTFIRLKMKVSDSELEKVKKQVPENLAKSPFGITLLKTGMGLGYDAVIISFHEDYTSYDNFRSNIKKTTVAEIIDLEVFLVSLDNENRYLPLTFSILANRLSAAKEKK
jgi:DNA-binding Lrp family transcriptional regulator